VVELCTSTNSAVAGCSQMTFSAAEKHGAAAKKVVAAAKKPPPPTVDRHAEIRD